MDIVMQIAPEVDRLVLSANETMIKDHGERVVEVAHQQGLADYRLIERLGPFIAAGRLTRDLAVTRMRYADTGQLARQLDELEATGRLRAADGFLLAGPEVMAVVEAISEALRQVTAAQWDADPEAVERASGTARRVGEAASDDHLVAVVHRELPEPDDPGSQLYQRLMTLRYVRQHDHIQAWLARELTAAQVVALTRVWRGGTVEAREPVVELAGRGLVELDPPRLTAAGTRIRQEIEAETNRRNAETFAVLSASEAEDFLATLRRLPGRA